MSGLKEIVDAVEKYVDARIERNGAEHNIDIFDEDVDTSLASLSDLVTAAISERDRYKAALERIAGHDPTKENAQSLFDAENIALRALGTL